MPATFVGMCASMIINPFLFKMNETIKQNNYKIFNQIVIKIILYVTAIGLLTLIATYFLGIPILNIIYGLDLSEVLWPLMIIVFASICTALVGVISNAMIAIRKNIPTNFVQFILPEIFTRAEQKISELKRLKANG